MVVALNLNVVAGSGGMDKCIKHGYVGDLLSLVIAHGRAEGVWITVQGHINTIAVGMMLATSAIILSEDIKATDEMIQKANEENIPLLSTSKTSFEIAVALGKYLGL